MKKMNFTLFVLIAIAIGTYAQIPNSGFENWTTYGNGMIPNGWWSTNDSINSTNSYFPITRSTDHYPESIGSYSIRLESNPSLSEWEQYGMVWPGNWSNNDSPSFPVTGHPDSLCGYYKFIPQNGDTMRILWMLYKNRIEVTQGTFFSASTFSNWTSFKIPVSNTSYESADSARIMISSFNSDKGFSVHGNSVLYIDNLSFDSLITNTSTSVKELSEDNSLSLYPNPATEMLTLNLNVTGKEGLVLSIYDIKGILVKSETLRQNQQTINIRNLSNGIYIVTFRTDSKIETKRLIIHR